MLRRSISPWTSSRSMASPRRSGASSAVAKTFCAARRTAPTRWACGPVRCAAPRWPGVHPASGPWSGDGAAAGPRCDSRAGDARDGAGLPRGVSEPLSCSPRVCTRMVRTKADIRATYDRIAESYAARRREPWPEVRLFIASLPRGARVLDVGAGHGRHTTVLADRGHRAVAFDFSRRLLSIGRAGEPRTGGALRIDWVGGEATKLPFRDASFDAGLCIAVF